MVFDTRDPFIPLFDSLVMDRPLFTDTSKSNSQGSCSSRLPRLLSMRVSGWNPVDSGRSRRVVLARPVDISPA